MCLRPYALRLKKQLSAKDNLALVSEGRLMILTWGCVKADEVGPGGSTAATQQRNKMQVDFLRKSIRSSLLGSMMQQKDGDDEDGGDALEQALSTCNRCGREQNHRRTSRAMNLGRPGIVEKKAFVWFCHFAARKPSKYGKTKSFRSSGNNNSHNSSKPRISFQEPETGKQLRVCKRAS